MQNEFAFSVVARTDRAGRQACTGSTLCVVVVLPLASQTCRCRSTVPAPNIPETQHPTTSVSFIDVVISLLKLKKLHKNRMGKLWKAHQPYYTCYYAMKCGWLIFKDYWGNTAHLRG